MKITMYTITDCQFSKQEREYLSAHGLQFEEKNLESNREFLTEMLAVGGNFAGTPVTKIEKDDGQIAVLKGFTSTEFDKTLGLAPAAAPVAPVVAEVAPQAPLAPPQEVVVQAPAAQPPVAAAPVMPVAAVTTDPAMASLLNNLEQQAQVVPQAPVVQAPVAPEAPIPGAPIIPDPQF